VNRLLRHLFLLLIIVLAGCATRPAQTEDAASPGPLAESDAVRLISAWQDRLCEYIAQEGNGDEAVLSELRGLRSRNVLRPARITFGALGVEANLPEWHGWDVQGVLVGMQNHGAFIRYVFVVGIVAYDRYVPARIQDIRLVGLSPVGGGLAWEMGAAAPAAVDRYRETFGGHGARRFPGIDDNFKMTSSRNGVSVREIRSGAEWSLELRAGEPVLASVAQPSASIPRNSGRGCE